MIESDHSETEEGDMERLQLSSDSIDIDTSSKRKRLRADDSEDETNLPAKKRQSSFSERSKILKNDNVETILDQNNTDGCNIKEESTLCPKNEQNVQKLSLSESNVDEECEKKQDSVLKQENGNKSPLDENNIAMNKNPVETDVKKKIFESQVITV